MHQRACRFITGLGEEIAAMNDERYEVGEVDITESIPTEHPELKPCIKLVQIVLVLSTNKWLH